MYLPRLLQIHCRIFLPYNPLSYFLQSINRSYLDLFELDNAVGKGENFIVDNDQTMMYSSRQAIELENECKSPYPLNGEMCIQMCA